MNSKLTMTATARGGWFTRADAVAAGYSDSQIRRRLASRRWERVCRNAYAEAQAAPASERPWERSARLHTRLARIVDERLGGRAVLSHQSAVVLHGLPVWSLDLRRVHVTKGTGRSRADDLMRCHRSTLGRSDIVELPGLRATSPARTLVDTACCSGYESAVVLFDAALRDGLVNREELASTVERLRHRPGSPHAAGALAFADGRSESVGESRLRMLLADYGLFPDLQTEIADAGGEVIARVDFCFPDVRVVIEFDGETKYRGQHGSEVVVAEKWREDRIRAQGYLVIRVGWADLDRPLLTIKRIRAAFAIAA